MTRGRTAMAAAVGLMAALLTPVGSSAYAAAAPTCGSYAQPVATTTLATPLWTQQWLDAGRVHALRTGAGVRVALLDTGVDGGHPQLAGAVEQGWDVVTGQPGVVDCAGLGTATASLVVARPAAGAALVGVAPQATIVPIRVSESGNGASSYRDVTPARLAEGVNRALAAGATVIGVSFAVVQDAPELRTAIAEAIRRGVVVVAAAGDATTVVTYPAGYDGVIGVGAIDASGLRWSSSGSGPQVDLVAPGHGLLAAARVGGHTTIDGTAAAAALVTGVAALVRSAEPSWTGEQVTHRLIATADGMAGGQRSDGYGFGCVNAYRALVEPITSAVPTAPWASPPVAAMDLPEAPQWSPETRRAILLASGLGIVTALIALCYAVISLRRRRVG